MRGEGWRGWRAGGLGLARLGQGQAEGDDLPGQAGIDTWSPG